VRKLQRQELRDAFNARGPYSIEDHPNIFKGDVLSFRGREIGQLDLWPSQEAVLVSKILVAPEHRGRGHGAGAMQQLVETANCLGVVLALTPDSSFGSSVPRLRRFYKRLGFIDNRGRRADHAISEAMYRPPDPARCRR
jgi:GNAT superfamily N-acetyltransferase